MRTPPSLRSLLLLLFALVAPAGAQDPVEYLLEGRDRQRGSFQGRLELTPGTDGPLVRRRAVFRDAVEALEARGRKQGHELRVEFPAGPGIAGAVGGAGAGAPLRLRVLFDEAEAELEGTLRRANQQVAREEGYRVRGLTPPGAAAGASLEALRPAPDSPGHAYRRFVGVPFVRGEGDAHEVDMNDVSQGSLGDCYFMAGLASVARTNPERVKAMIDDHGDGTFSVYAWHHNDQWEEPQVGPDGTYDFVRTAVRIRVDDAFPASGAGPAYAEFGDRETVEGVTRHELWPMLFEKAYAQVKGSYTAIEGGAASTSMSFFAHGEVTDHETSDSTVAQLRTLLERAQREGRAVTLGVPTSNSALGIYGNHYYAFWGLDAEGRVLLYNPWGSSHPPRGLTFEEVKQHIDSIHVGPR